MNAKALAARDAPPGRDRARRRGAGRLDGGPASRSTTRADALLGASPTSRGGETRFQRARVRRRLRLRDRDAAAPPQLDRSRRFPHGLGERRRPGGALRDGAGRIADRLRGSLELMRMYKAPPPEISTEQFYETDETTRLRARVLDRDARAAADRMGRARARRGPLGPVAARVHARLQPLDGARGRSASSSPSPRTGSRSLDETDA